MKHFIITIEALEESPEGDIRPLACEEHQLILKPEEQFLGICMMYKGSEPLKILDPS